MTTEQNKLADRIIEERVGWRDDGGRLGVFFNGSDMDLIVAALRAAGEPVAVTPDPTLTPLQEEQILMGFHNPPDEPAPSASVRKGAQHGATIEDAKAAIERGEYSDLPPLGDSRRTPSPLMAAGEAGETVPELTSDFAKALPCGPLDDSTYSAIEDALDAIDAPMTDGNRYMTLVERITALKQAMAEPTREEIAKTIALTYSREWILATSDDSELHHVSDDGWEDWLGAADAILALKPSGGQTREGGK